MIKVIGWDLGKVIVSFERRSEVFRRIAELFGGNLEAILEAVCIGNTESEAKYEKLDTGEITIKQLWQVFCNQGEISPKKLPLEEFGILFLGHHRPFMPVVELVHKLQNHFQLIAISNGVFEGRYLSNWLQLHYGIQWTELFISAEHQIKKPGLYDKVVAWCKKQGIELSSLVVVDDIANYVVAAQNKGFIGVQFNGSRETAEDLAQKLAKVEVFVWGE